MLPSEQARERVLVLGLPYTGSKERDAGVPARTAAGRRARMARNCMIKVMLIEWTIGMGKVMLIYWTIGMFVMLWVVSRS